MSEPIDTSGLPMSGGGKKRASKKGPKKGPKKSKKSKKGKPKRSVKRGGAAVIPQGYKPPEGFILNPDTGLVKEEATGNLYTRSGAAKRYKEILKEEKAVLDSLEEQFENILGDTAIWQSSENNLFKDIEYATEDLLKLIKKNDLPKVNKYFYAKNYKDGMDRVQRLLPFGREQGYQAAPRSKSSKKHVSTYSQNATNRGKRYDEIVKYAKDKTKFETEYKNLEQLWEEFLNLKDEHAREKVEEKNKLDSISEVLHKKHNFDVKSIRSYLKVCYKNWITEHKKEIGGTWLDGGTFDGFMKYLEAGKSR